MTHSESIKRRKTDGDGDGDGIDRRSVLIGIAGLGAAGVAYSAGSVAAAPEGEIGDAANPYLRAYIDRQVYTGRTTDPSTPADGTTWYRSDL